MKDIPHLLFNPPKPYRPLRVAMVSETYPPEINGVAHTAQCMAQGLVSRYHQVQLIRPRQHAQDQGEHSAAFEEILVRGMSMPRYAGLRIGLPATAELMRLWRTRRPHVVQIVTEGPLGWSAMVAARKLRLPAISEFHTNFHAYSRHYGMAMLGGPIRAYLRWFHNQTATTLVPTEALRHELASMGFRRLQVLARGVDTKRFNPARWNKLLRLSWGCGDHTLVALHVGRLAAEKNLPLVIETFRHLQAERPDMKLVMVGDGPERAALQARNPDVVFSGMRQGEDLAEHYASADLLLFPSTTETFGNVVLEAMASGLPVVAYDYAAAREYIRHGENGLRAAFSDPLAFINQARNLVSDLENARRLGRNARVSAEGMAWDHIHDRFERLIAATVKQWERNHDGKAQMSFAPDL